MFDQVTLYCSLEVLQYLKSSQVKHTPKISLMIMNLHTQLPASSLNLNSYMYSLLIWQEDIRNFSEIVLFWLSSYLLILVCSHYRVKCY